MTNGLSHSRGLTVLATVAAGIVVGATAVSQLASLGGSLLVLSVYLKDLFQCYLAARAAREGLDHTLSLPELTSLISTGSGVDLALWLPHLSPYPPTAALLLLPISFLDFPAAAAAWLNLELLLLGLSLWGVLHTLGFRRPASLIPVVTLASLAWGPIAFDLHLGQMSIPLLAMAFVALLSLRIGRWELAGVALGGSMLVKPLLWPVLAAYALRRQWAVVLPAAGVSAAGYSLAAAVLGPGTMGRYLTTVLPETTARYQDVAWNISWWTIGWRVFSGAVDVRPPQSLLFAPLVHAPALAPSLAAVLPGIVLALAFYAASRTHGLHTVLGVMVCASILVSPIAWRHYLVLMILPLSVMAWQLKERRLPARQTKLALLALLTLLPSLLWEQGALFLGVLASPSTVEGGPAPFLAGLVLLAPTLGVAMVAWLLVRLDSTALPREEMTRGEEEAHVGKKG